MYFLVEICGGRSECGGEDGATQRRSDSTGGVGKLEGGDGEGTCGESHGGFRASKGASSCGSRLVVYDTGCMAVVLADRVGRSNLVP